MKITSLAFLFFFLNLANIFINIKDSWFELLAKDDGL